MMFGVEIRFIIIFIFLPKDQKSRVKKSRNELFVVSRALVFK